MDLDTVKTPMQVAHNQYTRCRAQNEVAARAAFELCGGHSLTDAEWAASRTRLVALMSILREWDRERFPTAKRYC